MKIAHARIGSNGQVSGDAVGDQGKEVCITNWYSKPWDYMIRAKNPQMGLRISNAAIAITEINCGYDQSRRNDLIKDAEAVDMVIKKITKPTSCDCSSFVTACCINAGVPKAAVVKYDNASTTRTLRANLEATGMFSIFNGKEYTTSDKNLLKGDILLSEGHHVVVCIENSNENCNYYPKYTGNSVSIVVALSEVGEIDTTLKHRTAIYNANGLNYGTYTGTADQNTAMLELLKDGKLMRA